jgi:CheY-like chemotaxis protein
MSGSERKVILVVDDNADVRASLGLLLGMLGYHVEKAADGAEALRYLRTHPRPCLIVLDLRMPGMDGWQFRQAQLRDADLAEIPVVVSSGEAETGGRELLGEVAFHTNGGNPLDLLRLVQSMCA